MGAKKGFLLIEVLLSLLILSIIAIPWITYLKNVSDNNLYKETALYFQAKQVFLEAVNKRMFTNKIESKDTVIVVSQTPINKNVKQLKVDLTYKGKLMYSLVGVVK